MNTPQLDRRLLWAQACYWLYRLEHGLTPEEFLHLAFWLARPGAAEQLEDVFVTELLVMARLTRMMRENLGQMALASSTELTAHSGARAASPRSVSVSAS